MRSQIEIRRARPYKSLSVRYFSSLACSSLKALKPNKATNHTSQLGNEGTRALALDGLAECFHQERFPVVGCVTRSQTTPAQKHDQCSVKVSALIHDLACMDR